MDLQGEGIMAELHVLKTAVDNERMDSIDILEEILAEAKAGNIQSVLIAIVKPDTAMGSTWSSGTAGLMLGAIRMLEHQFIKEAIDGEDGDGSV